MSYSTNDAPGRPGIPPTWSSSAKDFVTTALGTSRLWATFGYGILNEVYWPATGYPQIRDLGFIVAGPHGWTEVKRAQRYTLSTPKPFIPLPKFVHEGETYRLELEFLPHPLRDVLLIRYNLEADDARLYPMLAPHLAARRSNDAWADDDLVASTDGVAVCLHADTGFMRTSAGFVGVSDGWQDFNANGKMTRTHEQALDGNVALIGECANKSGTLALSFAETREGARTLARSSLADDYEELRRLFVDRWESWGETLDIPDASPELKREAELSAAVIKIHEDRTYAGAIVASLSVPWGSSHDDPGGYHLVWTRDTVMAALAMITVGQTEDAARTLAYLVGTQAEDGSWAQNYYPDGTGYWSGSQLDEVALPILLMAKLRAVGHLNASMQIETMVHKAIGYIVRNGPMTDQDRWEENAGASPFTLAVTICALVAAAESFAGEERDYLLSLADCWNERIEGWTYTQNGPLAADHDIDGYYVRLGPPGSDGDLSVPVQVRNVADGSMPADALVGMEFLALVRMGLRSAKDKRVTDTLALVDSMLKAQTPSGPSFHRYNGDGYGEHADGSAFSGIGIGRLWPLLTAERGHYEISRGKTAKSYLDAMTRMTGPGGLLPEQVWDTEPIPALGLKPGKPSGSAMPLVWAHAEFLKLLAAEIGGRPVELLDEVESRYGGKAPEARQWHWRKNSQFTRMPTDRQLVIEASEPFELRFGVDDWTRITDRTANQTAFGMYGVSLGPEDLHGARSVVFTFRYPENNQWEGQDYEVTFD